jgi:hypothetical protein
MGQLVQPNLGVGVAPGDGVVPPRHRGVAVQVAFESKL